MNVGGVVYIPAPQFKDLRGSPSENKHVLSDIIIIDKTDPSAPHPLVYQMKQTTAEEIKNSPHFDVEWLKSQSEPFFLLGEMQTIDKKQKLIYLTNDQTINYNYLVVVAGNKGAFISQNLTMEFTAGIQALVEALKIRRKGISPQAPTSGKMRSKSQSKPNAAAKESNKNLKSVARKNLTSTHEHETSSESDAAPDSKINFQVCV